MPNKTCRLCNEEKNLCRAHIWPDGLKTMLLKDSKNFVTASIVRGIGRKIQTLEYDKSILCADCDGALGFYDKVFVEFIRLYFEHPQRQIRLDRKQPANRITLDVDTAKLNLALVSIIMRMSFSTRTPSVNLGKTYETMFKNWLMHRGIPQNEAYRFGVVAIGYAKDEHNFDRMIIMQPTAGEKSGSHYYFFDMIFGLTIVLKVGQGPWIDNLGKYPKITHRKDTLEIPLCDPKDALSMEHLIKLKRNMTSHANKNRSSLKSIQ